MKDMCAYYGYTGELPVHVLEALAQEKDPQRVLQKLHMHMLVLWAKGEIPGPPTPENIEARAKRAESLGAWFKKMNKLDQAKKQAAKAADIRRTKPASGDKRWW